MGSEMCIRDSDGTVDDDNMIYVEEWQCMNELSEAQHEELDKIIKIFS